MSIVVCLPRPQRRRMQRLYRKTKSRLESTRCRVLLLHAGLGASEVAYTVDCVRATVYRTVYRFEELGEAGLHDQRSCRGPTKATPEVEEHLLGYLDWVPSDYGWDRANWTLELLSRQLFADTEVELSRSHIYELLRSWGCRRGRPRPGLRIPVRGRRKTLDKIEKIVAQASPEDEVFYQDEADVHLNPKIGATYLKRGHQPVVLTPGKNVKRYIFGALNARHRANHLRRGGEQELGGLRSVPRLPQQPIPSRQAYSSRARQLHHSQGALRHPPARSTGRAHRAPLPAALFA